MSFYEVANHRSEEQLQEMVRLEREGVCLFCAVDQLDSQRPYVLHRTRSWTVTRNRFPYRGTRLHLLLVPRAHVRDVLELPAEALADLWAALAWVRDEFRLEYYGIAVRCGDCRLTGGSIEHTHVHVVVGDVDDPDHEPVRIKLSSRPPATG